MSIALLPPLANVAASVALLLLLLLLLEDVAGIGTGSSITTSSCSCGCDFEYPKREGMNEPNAKVGISVPRLQRKWWLWW